MAMFPPPQSHSHLRSAYLRRLHAREASLFHKFQQSLSLLRESDPDLFDIFYGENALDRTAPLNVAPSRQLLDAVAHDPDPAQSLLLILIAELVQNQMDGIVRTVVAGAGEQQLCSLLDFRDSADLHIYLLRKAVLRVSPWEEHSEPEETIFVKRFSLIVHDESTELGRLDEIVDEGQQLSAIDVGYVIVRYSQFETNVTLVQLFQPMLQREHMMVNSSDKSDGLVTIPTDFMDDFPIVQGGRHGFGLKMMFSHNQPHMTELSIYGSINISNKADIAHWRVTRTAEARIRGKLVSTLPVELRRMIRKAGQPSEASTFLVHFMRFGPEARISKEVISATHTLMHTSIHQHQAQLINLPGFIMFDQTRMPDSLDGAVFLNGQRTRCPQLQGCKYVFYVHDCTKNGMSNTKRVALEPNPFQECVVSACKRVKEEGKGQYVKEAKRFIIDTAVAVYKSNEISISASPDLVTHVAPATPAIANQQVLSTESCWVHGLPEMFKELPWRNVPSIVFEKDKTLLCRPQDLMLFDHILTPLHETTGLQLLAVGAELRSVSALPLDTEDIVWKVLQTATPNEQCGYRIQHAIRSESNMWLFEILAGIHEYYQGSEQSSSSRVEYVWQSECRLELPLVRSGNWLLVTEASCAVVHSQLSRRPPSTDQKEVCECLSIANVFDVLLQDLTARDFQLRFLVNRLWRPYIERWKSGEFVSLPPLPIVDPVINLVPRSLSKAKPDQQPQDPRKSETVATENGKRINEAKSATQINEQKYEDTKHEEELAQFEGRSVDLSWLATNCCSRFHPTEAEGYVDCGEDINNEDATQSQFACSRFKGHLYVTAQFQSLPGMKFARTDDVWSSERIMLHALSSFEMSSIVEGSKHTVFVTPDFNQVFGDSEQQTVARLAGRVLVAWQLLSIALGQKLEEYPPIRFIYAPEDNSSTVAFNHSTLIYIIVKPSNEHVCSSKWLLTLVHEMLHNRMVHHSGHFAAAMQDMMHELASARVLGSGLSAFDVCKIKDDL